MWHESPHDLWVRIGVKFDPTQLYRRNAAEDISALPDLISFRSTAQP
jgi:hypothetical protein